MIAGLPADAVQRLAEAAEWRLLALLFSRPRSGWREEVESLAREVSDPALRETAGLARDAQEGPYHALLGPGGAASAREVAYCGWSDPGRLLAKIAAQYEAFAFTPQSEDPADHLSVEADFVAYLLVKEVHAAALGEEEAAAVTREARESFLAEHVSALARGLAGRLANGPGYLTGAARALTERVAHVPERPIPTTPCADPLESGCPMAGEGCAPKA